MCETRRNIISADLLSSHYGSTRDHTHQFVFYLLFMMFEIFLRKPSCQIFFQIKYWWWFWPGQKNDSSFNFCVSSLMFLIQMIFRNESIWKKNRNLHRLLKWHRKGWMSTKNKICQPSRTRSDTDTSIIYQLDLHQKELSTSTQRMVNLLWHHHTPVKPCIYVNDLRNTSKTCEIQRIKMMQMPNWWIYSKKMRPLKSSS